MSSSPPKKKCVQDQCVGEVWKKYLYSLGGAPTYEKAELGHPITWYFV